MSDAGDASVGGETASTGGDGNPTMRRSGRRSIPVNKDYQTLDTHGPSRRGPRGPRKGKVEKEKAKQQLAARQRLLQEQQYQQQYQQQYYASGGYAQQQQPHPQYAATAGAYYQTHPYHAAYYQQQQQQQQQEQAAQQWFKYAYAPTADPHADSLLWAGAMLDKASGAVGLVYDVITEQGKWALTEKLHLEACAPSTSSAAPPQDKATRYLRLRQAPKALSAVIRKGDMLLAANGRALVGPRRAVEGALAAAYEEGGLRRLRLARRLTSPSLAELRLLSFPSSSSDPPPFVARFLLGPESGLLLDWLASDMPTPLARALVPPTLPHSSAMQARNKRQQQQQQQPVQQVAAPVAYPTQHQQAQASHPPRPQQRHQQAHAPPLLPPQQQHQHQRRTVDAGAVPAPAQPPPPSPPPPPPPPQPQQAVAPITTSASPWVPVVTVTARSPVYASAFGQASSMGVVQQQQMHFQTPAPACAPAAATLTGGYASGVHAPPPQGQMQHPQHPQLQQQQQVQYQQQMQYQQQGQQQQGYGGGG